MNNKRKRGRPMSSHNVSVTPEYREIPDIEKLGRVLLSVAMSRSQTKENGDGAEVLPGNFSATKERGML